MIDMIIAPSNEFPTQPRSLRRAAAKLTEARNGIIEAC